MPFESPTMQDRRIAVIGGGISGMIAAYMLAPKYSVTLIESKRRLGGHARTVIAGNRRDQPVDTGFIVFNRANYPCLSALFEEIGVEICESNMSFCASIKGGRLEYGLANLDKVFAQRCNLLKPSYLRMLRDILHFNKNAERVAKPGMSIGDLLETLGTGPYFRDYYITPFSGAIWSTPTKKILDFPADAMITFFKNHHLMSKKGQHQWYTVKNGSVEYVTRLHMEMIKRGVEMKLGAHVNCVKRSGSRVSLRVTRGAWEDFDEVVFATHSDETLAMLSNPTPEEYTALSAIRYQNNHAILHCDESVMPRSRKVWSSWAYVEPSSGAGKRINLTYWMNSLQNIPESDPHFVTLNSDENVIHDEYIYDSTTFRHPLYNRDTVKAQATIRALNGKSNIWFCGAWMKNGFHEDGYTSAIDIVNAMETLQNQKNPLRAKE